MPVAKPGKRLMHSIPLRFVQKRVSGGGHKGVNADLNLTSMIDYLVITVVFLLSQFGAQQQMQSTQDLEIPRVPHSDHMRSAPIVSISQQMVLLDGNRITTPRELANVTDRIDRLYERLEQARREYPVIHPTEHFEGDIVFQIDKRVSWQVIKTVAKTCALAGYTRLNFAITRGNADIQAQ